MTATAGFTVLFVVAECRRTIALGGSGWTKVVFAVARLSGRSFLGSVSTLAVTPAGGIVRLLEERTRNGGMTDLARPQAAIWTQVSWRQTRKALARARRY